MRVTIIYSQQQGAPLTQLSLTLAEGATIEEALDEAQFYKRFPEARGLTVGIYSKPYPMDHLLRHEDRLEVYRSLCVDPKLARRKRAKAP